MRKTTFRTASITIVVALMFALISWQPAFATPNGTVLIAKGLVTATSAGDQSRALSKGEAVNEGDVINTAAKSFAVIRMMDKTKLTLKPSTSIAIGKFDLTEGKEEGCLNLLKGGLRTVTGLIGERNPEKFQLDSVVASIGIRGTDFTARICAGEECQTDESQYLENEYEPVEKPTLPESINEELPEGLYSSCATGVIAVSQCAGQIEDFEVGKCRVNQQKDCVDIILSAGQAGYVSYGAERLGDNSGILPFIPHFLLSDPHFRLSELDDQKLELIELFKDEFSTGEYCEVVN